MRTKQRWSSKFQVKSGSWIFVPTHEMTLYGSAIKESIESFWTPPPFYFHLRNGGHVKALESHLIHNTYLHLDISNFFGCVNKSRVTRCLKEYYGYEKARSIALTSTVIDPNNKKTGKSILPFGFVQSPIIASICLHKSKLGKYLFDINKMNNVTVSVYMDDITISSNCLKTLSTIMAAIEPISEASRFHLNKLKQEGPSNKITAFNIEISQGRLALTANRLQEFKAAYKSSDNLNVLHGIIGYVETVNIQQSSELK